ncbi:hypothetical protein ACLMAJ_12340 [Nocardia sp. KC 131]|uniref:hypothetical protein n=1 Tax=Nocardia arseniciresistens TaxID=3392119 RepID=UPI00398EBDCD
MVFVGSVVATLAAVSGGATSAARVPDEGAVTVQAVTGLDRIPVTGVVTGVTSCAAGPVLATLTTGGDGTVTSSFPDGCYQVEVTAVPSGCQLASDAYAQVTVAPDVTPVAEFWFRCA